MMRWRPAQKYTLASASRKARTLHSGAFAKYAADSERGHRFQVLVEDFDFSRGWPKATPQTYLVASGPDWVTALERFHDWWREHHGEEEEREPDGRNG